MINETERHLQALIAAQQEVVGASQQLQAMQEKVQSLSLINAQCYIAIEQQSRLIAMLKDHITGQHAQVVQLDLAYQDQRQANEALAGQLETTHLQIADLQKKGRV
jgi:hypothetical protein